MVIISSSLVTPEVVVATTSGAASDDEIVTITGFVPQMTYPSLPSCMTLTKATATLKPLEGLPSSSSQDGHVQLVFWRTCSRRESRWSAATYNSDVTMDPSRKFHNAPVLRNAPFSNRNVHMCAHFSYKMVHCRIFVWCIVGFVRWVYIIRWWRDGQWFMGQ